MVVDVVLLYGAREVVSNGVRILCLLVAVGTPKCEAFGVDFQIRYGMVSFSSLLPFFIFFKSENEDFF